MSHNPSARLRVLIEHYPERFTQDRWGGIETAYWHLARSLADTGIDVRWFDARTCPRAADLACCLREGAYTAVFPLVENPIFRTATLLEPALRHRIVRIWHDTSALAPRFSALTPCPIHQTRVAATQATCPARSVSPSACAADIFFHEAPWTYCFPNRQYIPWAADHVPPCDYHDPHGPLVLLAGKIPLEELHLILDACLRCQFRLRIIFSNWSRRGEEAKAYIASRQLGAEHQIIETYDLMSEYERLFAGVSAALVLSHYYETFNFLVAEAVQLGIPAVAFSRSGATQRFASHLVDDGMSLVNWLASGGVSQLRPLPRPAWSWRDVATAYAQLIRRLDHRRTDPSHWRQNKT